MTNAAQLAAYNRSVIMSATPVQLLVMLYDRLILDLTRAKANQEAQEWDLASKQLRHAQDIVDELQTTLKRGVWDGAEDLFAIYTHVSTALVQANIHRDVSATEDALTVLGPLRDAWHEAAASLPAGHEGTRGIA